MDDAGSTARRPHEIYKTELLGRISQLRPGSLLDVGCGEGGLVRAAAGMGIERSSGLEVDIARVEGLRACGLEAMVGVAEALPVADQSFDVVVLEYVAHHCTDLAMALAEAIRVARRAVLVLDPWYDPSLASQRVARRFDDWLKVIDRQTGMVHNPCPNAADVAAPFLAAGGFDVDLVFRLVLTPMPLARLDRSAQGHLALIGRSTDLEASYAEIREAAVRDGVTEDGALLFQAVRTGT